MEPKKHDLFTECFISALDENGKYSPITNNLKHISDISYDNIDFDDNTTEKYLLSPEQLSFDFTATLSCFSNNWKKMHNLPKIPRHKITNMYRKGTLWKSI